jgi:hypothetical protein
MALGFIDGLIEDWSTQTSPGSIVDWNIHTLSKLVNRNFQKEKVKKVGCLLPPKSLPGTKN